jgi:hypothetical protein
MLPYDRKVPKGNKVLTKTTVNKQKVLVAFLGELFSEHAGGYLGSKRRFFWQ